MRQTLKFHGPPVTTGVTASAAHVSPSSAYTEIASASNQMPPVFTRPSMRERMCSERILAVLILGPTLCYPQQAQPAQAPPRDTSPQVLNVQAERSAS